ncbi:DUF4295 domain-containing protein [Blattabacterium cuenoti]|uniref:DUF4295 domain-containing protein n=1 Tax=Blattabacterium cuenoti TaxID=1653831 RepID=UPI00163BB293|nr:DUF4295 domain-containing protein [Blattabacterium cuenoti]
MSSKTKIYKNPSKSKKLELENKKKIEKKKMILAIKMIKSNKENIYKFDKKMINEKEINNFFLNKS